MLLYFTDKIAYKLYRAFNFYMVIPARAWQPLTRHVLTGEKR